MQPRIVEVREGILKKNDLLARELRERFEKAGLVVVSLVSSPGAGKTALLEATLGALKARRRVAALVGDLATDNDARRLGRAGVPVRQIVTGTVCHLEAQMVGQALEGWDLAALDLLFLENVGNLVCPASWDLGESAKVVVFSVTEGEDKPLKYPKMFRMADAVIINKIDLLPYVPFDMALAEKYLREVNPAITILRTSALTGEGMDTWYGYLLERMASARAR
jgi:hydrogenase nickel incorporation protein HypB